jgi:ATP-binding cassette subfamily C protein LapB
VRTGKDAGNPEASTAPARPAAAIDDQRLRNRAGLISAFAALKGVSIPAEDLAEFFQAQTSADFDAAAVSAGLSHAGLNPKTRQKVKPQPAAWPGFAEMSNGQWVLVLSQDGEALTIYDTTCPDNQADVPLSEFSPFFSGTVISARVPLARLAARHTPQAGSGHWFWGEFQRYRRQMGEVMLGSLVANLLAVAVALFSLQVYDRVIPHQSQATLWVLAGGALLAVLLEGSLKFARARLTDAAGRQIELSVQARLMQRLIGMRADKRPLPPSGLFAAMRDFGSVREFFTSSTLSTLADIPFIAVFLLLVASIAGPIVWALVLGGILMLLPAYFMQKRMIALTRQTQGANAKAGRLLHEVVSELETVKTQRGETRVLRLWDELNELSSQSSAAQRRLSGALTYWSQGVQQATYISAVVLGTYMVFAGQFTVGTIIATGILTSRTLAPLTQFAATLARWSNVKAALEALDAIAEAPQETTENRSTLRRPQLRGDFELRELTYRYNPDGAPVLDVPGIAIKASQSVAILGTNGSGKSTLLKLLAGLYTPDSGRVLLDGTGMEQIDPRDLRRSIGYLGQDVRLFAGTLRDNLNLNLLEQDGDRLMAALDFAGLGAFVRGHPRGLDLEIGDGGAGLSQGQRQSIGWARLWLQDPAIVLLDEPTAALDQTLERTLVSRLETWLHGRTAIIATHRMPIVALTSRTLILQAGRMVVDGPRDKVLAHLAAGDSK